MKLVSIGLPVYNGENYIEEAIQSVLDQTYPDVELVISDNASSDGTENICREFAEANSHVKYHRNESNLGAGPNYNIAWEKSSGSFFKWLAHDDRLLPEYVATTVQALENTPDAVLCNTVVDYIGANGNHRGYYTSVLKDAGVSDPALRFATMILKTHTCVDFFGMIRRPAMVGSVLHGTYHGCDRAFIAQMALRGRLLQLETPLIQMREHPHRYTRQANTAQLRKKWHDAAKSGIKEVPSWKLYQVYLQFVESESLSDHDRWASRKVLKRFWFTNWNFVRLIADIISIPIPRAFDFAVIVKYRLFGAPGNFSSNDHRRL